MEEQDALVTFLCKGAGESEAIDGIRINLGDLEVNIEMVCGYIDPYQFNTLRGIEASCYNVKLRYV